MNYDHCDEIDYSTNYSNLHLTSSLTLVITNMLSTSLWNSTGSYLNEGKAQ